MSRMTAAKTNTRLPEIAKAIKTLEKKTIQNAVEIGKLLHEAYEQCEHGEFMDWLKSNFGWSYNTLLRHRNVYDLSQNRQFGDFAKWDISISVLYLIAGNIKKYGEERRACEAIIEAAKHGRVSYRVASDIIRKCREEYAAQRAAAYDAAHPDYPAIAGDASPQPAAPDDPEDDSPENDDSPNDEEAAPAEIGGKQVRNVHLGQTDHLPIERAAPQAGALVWTEKKVFGAAMGGHSFSISPSLDTLCGYFVKYHENGQSFDCGDAHTLEQAKEIAQRVHDRGVRMHADAPKAVAAPGMPDLPACLDRRPAKAEAH